MPPELAPELRAAADRLMHTGGYLRYLASEMRTNELERHCKATGLTVRQTFGHIVLWLECEVERSGQLLGGEDVLEASLDVDDVNRGFAEASRYSPLTELIERFLKAYRAQIAVYARVSSEMGAREVRGTTVSALLLELTAHGQRHAVDFAEALPRLRFDPLLLDWALAAQLREPDELHRQLKLAAAARAHLRAREESDDA